MNAKPTPGPWEIHKRAVAWQRSFSGGFYWDFPFIAGSLQTCVRGKTKAEAEANAGLIVAAVNLAFEVNPDDPIAAINTLLELWKKESSKP